MVKFGRVVFELCKRTDRQTPDIHVFITILRIPRYGIVEFYSGPRIPSDVILLHYFHYIRAYRQASGYIFFIMYKTGTMYVGRVKPH